MIKMKHQRLLARCWLVAVDRMNGMYEQDYQFRDVYMLSTAAEDEDLTNYYQLSIINVQRSCIGLY